MKNSNILLIIWLLINAWNTSKCVYAQKAAFVSTPTHLTTLENDTTIIEKDMIFKLH